MKVTPVVFFSERARGYCGPESHGQSGSLPPGRVRRSVEQTEINHFYASFQNVFGENTLQYTSIKV